jgi:membrane protease subunit (stomatin/prohibitin family)
MVTAIASNSLANMQQQHQHQQQAAALQPAARRTHCHYIQHTG